MDPQIVTIKDEYITLGQLLKLTELIQSGGQAKAFLSMATIYINGDKENRRGKKLYPGDHVVIEGKGSYEIVR